MFVYYPGTVSGASTGWQFRIYGGTWTSANTALPTQGVLFRSVPAFTIDLRPTASVSPGSRGQVSIAVSCTSGCAFAQAGYSSILDASRLVAAPTAADLQLVCTPATVTIGAGQPQLVSCVYSGKSSLGSRQAMLTRLVIPAPTGWAITSTSGTVAGTTLTITPNAPITYAVSAPLSYSFSYTLTSSCTASAAAQTMTLTSQFTFGTTSNIAGAGATGQVTRSNVSTLSMSVRSSSMSWSRTASFEDMTVNGNLMYRIVATGCSGWSVSVSSGAYTYSGPNNGTTIPASNLQLTNSGNPIVIIGTASGVTRKDVSGSMATPHKILGASIGAGNGTYEQQLDFSLTIPGQSLAGSYQSTITLTSAAAP